MKRSLKDTFTIFFLMIQGLQVRWYEGRSIISGDRDTIVSWLTDSFSLCNISCRAAFHPRHNSRRVCSIIFQLRSIMSLTAAASVKNIIALGKKSRQNVQVSNVS